MCGATRRCIVPRSLKGFGGVGLDSTTRTQLPSIPWAVIDNFEAGNGITVGIINRPVGLQSKDDRESPRED